MADSEPKIGSPDAAQDLYGIGVRIGVYLQAFGLILYNYSDKEDAGKGLKVASGSITVSILASWFVFAANSFFSPSEAVITLLLLLSLSFPAKTTLLNPQTILGETLGLVTLLLSELGVCSALLWTFAKLVNTLPTLGTDNVVFFFARVSINGWFRYLALVYVVIDAATSISFAIKIVRLLPKSWASEVDASEVQGILEWKDVDGPIRHLRWLVWVLVVIVVELTIKWNHLMPSNNLQSPGQLIPMATGIIIFIDSSIVAGRSLRSYLSQLIERLLRKFL